MNEIARAPKGPVGKWEECQRCVTDPDFWDTVRWTRVLLKPLKDFGAWVKGCDCHESERKAGKKVCCPWQGCRARTLGAQVAAVLEEMRKMRTAGLSMGDEADIVLARMMHVFGQKMAWVSQEPALLWQAWDREVAARIVADRDRVVADGGRYLRNSRNLVFQTNSGNWILGLWMFSTL